VRNDNLTRRETADRSELVAVESYDVLLDLSTAPDPEADSFRSVTTVRFAAEEGAQTFLDFIGRSVESVTVNGRELDPDDVVEGARIRLPSLEAANEVTVAGRGLYSRSGEGMHRFVDPADGRVYLYTQYEPADARRVFANFEQPDLKASFRFTVLAPDGWQVSSNGVRMAASPAPEAERPGAVRHEFAPTERISTYITTVLAGPYHRVAGEWRHSFEDGSRMSVPLALYCRASLAEHLDAATGARELFDLTRQGLTFFTELFGYPYPFGKYEQAFVPEYNLGAMENPGLVTFTEEYLFPDGATRAQYQGRANTLMHEMSHMWFGDLVTMTWWDDLWLKESFAEFMGAHASVQATDFEEAWIAFADRRKAWAYRQDQLPTTHPVVADIHDLEAARQNFDGITYAKGAAVLKQLVAFVGYGAFVDACRAYFRRHAYGSTTLEDFLAVLEEASGRDVRGWAESWLGTSGVTSLALDLARDDDGTVTFAALLQDPGAGVLRPHRLLLGGYERGPGDVLVRTGTVSVDLPAESSVEVPELVGSTAPLLVVNDEDLTYAKTRLDPLSLTTALSSLSSVEDDMARAQLWSGLWNDRDVLHRRGPRRGGRRAVHPDRPAGPAAGPAARRRRPGAAPGGSGQRPAAGPRPAHRPHGPARRQPRRLAARPPGRAGRAARAAAGLGPALGAVDGARGHRPRRGPRPGRRPGTGARRRPDPHRAGRLGPGPRRPPAPPGQGGGLGRDHR
jgi:aminopeptidase N